MATKAGDFSFDVFLSHNSRDRPRVRELALALTGRGLRVWLDETDLTPGRPWQQLLEQGIKASRAVIVTYGESDFGPWEEPEMRAALRLAARDDRTVIPVLLPGSPSESELPLFLQSYSWADLRDGLSETGLDRLERRIRGDASERGLPPLAAEKPIKSGLRPSWLLAPLLIAAMALAAFVWRSSALDTVYLTVVDTNSKPVAGVSIAPAGRGETLEATNDEGKTRLSLPSSTVVGEWVTLSIVPASDRVQPEWVFISPWDGRVRVPPFNDRADNYAPIVLGRRYDRDLLTSGEALRAITQRILYALQRQSEGVTEAERQQVLAEQAAAFGLDPIEVDEAIRGWQERSEDPFEKGLITLSKGQYRAASEHLERALDAARIQREEGTRKFIEAARYLGQSLREQGKYQKSVETYREAIALRADDPDLLKGLCWSLGEAGELEEAERHCRSALELYRRDLADMHPLTVRAMHSLAAVLSLQTRYAEAEPLMRRVLAIDESLSGPNHPDVARDLNNLSILLKYTNRFDEAEQLMRRALSIDENSTRVSSPAVARDLNNLGALLRDEKRFDEAEPLMRRAVAIAESVLDSDHPDVAIYLSALASVLRATNHLDEAEPLLRRALKINTITFGVDHRRTKYIRTALDDLLAAKLTSQLWTLEIDQDNNRLISGSPRLIKKVEMRGHVVDAAGRPVAGVRVWIAGYSEGFVESDENGSFTLSVQAVEGHDVHVLVARQDAPAEDFWILAGGPAVPLRLRAP